MKYETLYNMLPVEEEGKMVLGLETMEQLMDILDHPENKTPIIHIAGTNGKGSTAAFIASVLEESGYSVGLFTSPSLVEFNERIRINHEPISNDSLLSLVETLKNKVNSHQIRFTEFELFTALAYMAFDEKNVDVAIMEVGLGGKLDATNIVQKPVMSIITKIAKDHQAILGDTIAEIAGEKAGIIKPDVPVVVYPQAYPDAQRVLEEVAQKVGTDFHDVQLSTIAYDLNNTIKQPFTYRGEEFEISLLEEHQIWNASVAIEALKLLQKLGWSKITEETLNSGILNTVWPARFEKIDEKPIVVVDSSHNPDGMFELAKNLKRYFSDKKITAIVGMLADKDVDNALSHVLPLFEHVVTVRPESDRALTADELAQKIRDYDLSPIDQIYSAETYSEAYDKALEVTDESDVIVVIGSTYYVGIIRKIILERKGNYFNG